MIFNMAQGKAAKYNRGPETIIPTTTDQIIRSETYIDGDITLKGDSNLVPSSIADGKSIFGVNGTNGSSGIFIDETDALGNPTAIRVRNIYLENYGLAMYEDKYGIFSKIQKVDIENCNHLGSYVLRKAEFTRMKIKNSIVATKCFNYSINANVKLWIDNKTDFSFTSSQFTASPFYNNSWSIAANSIFYCERPAKPSNWINDWAAFGLNGSTYEITSPTIIWGVTEAQFDAL